MSKYIHLDNTITEKIGTGKSISVMDKGIEAWAMGLSSGIWNGSGLIASFIISLYYLSTIHYSASIAFIFIFFISLAFAGVMNTKMLEIRSLRNEQEHLYTKHLVKNIMNKFEVMQSFQNVAEQKKLSEYADGAKFYNIKMSPYFHAFHHVPSFILSLLKLGFLYYVSSFIFSGDLGVSTFVGLFGIMLILEGTVMRFIEFFKQFSRDFAMIEYLWTFFDTTPQIEGYETGNTFKHKTGAIELKNVNYGYTQENPIFENFNLSIPGKQITA
ncbi:hypothetical protein N9J72_01530, partial [Candidatus Gracilibacteria bacterium]|nr:hypothetical protein [Candidatus Gracilibacteria bacterium]